ncbi:MAG: nucleotide exchange factor GrpE [Pirellulaceae bacterium]
MNNDSMMNDDYDYDFNRPVREPERFSSQPEIQENADLARPLFENPNRGFDEPSNEHFDDDEPQFGLIDIIEAFTALRQEYRGQTKEVRQFVETISGAIEQIQLLESQRRNEVSLLSEASEAVGKNDDMARRLVDTIVQIDLALSRAVDATRSAEHEKNSVESLMRQPLNTLRQEIGERFQSQSFLCRWVAKAFLAQVLQSVDSQIDQLPDKKPDSTTEGFRMIAARVHSLLSEHQIERIDTDNMPFDGEIMNAVQAVVSDRPSGTVVSQISPAYYWRGKLIRYADVTVAK